MEPKTLREWMDERGWSVRRLASALDGMAPSTVQNYRDGSRVPDALVAEAIARRLNVPVDAILWGRVDLRRDLLEMMAAHPAGVPEAELLERYEGEERQAAQQELRRLSLLCDAALLSGGWVAVE